MKTSILDFRKHIVSIRWKSVKYYRKMSQILFGVIESVEPCEMTKTTLNAKPRVTVSTKVNRLNWYVKWTYSKWKVTRLTMSLKNVKMKMSKIFLIEGSRWTFLNSNSIASISQISHNSYIQCIEMKVRCVSLVQN
jgi:hypothetical protein